MYHKNCRHNRESIGQQRIYIQVPVEKNSDQWTHAYWDSPKACHYDIDIISQWSLWISGNDDDYGDDNGDDDDEDNDDDIEDDNTNYDDDHNDQDKNIKELQLILPWGDSKR